MKNKANRPKQAAKLRRQAEEFVRGKTTHSPEAPETQSPEEIRQMLHELRIHQIELEMQNEELRRTQEELESSWARYFDLYDLAPVGYVTLSEKGMILEANLTAAGLLGLAKDELVKQPLTRFILSEDQGIYYRHRKQLFETGEPQLCELRMKKKDGTTFWGGLEATHARDIDGAPMCRIVMTDITARKQAEAALRAIESHYMDQLFSAQEDERKWVALEVHDVLGSSLNAIKFMIECIIQNIDDVSVNQVIDDLENIFPVIKKAIEHVRRIQANLRPPHLDDLGIVTTLSWFCRIFEMIYSNIRIEQAVTVQEKEVPNHIKIVIFRIIQDGMNTVGKYAKADSVYLGLRKVDGAIELCIRDNGEGFNLESLSPEEINKKDLWLTNMKERTECSGGSFSITSSKGKGTVIRAVWPV